MLTKTYPDGSKFGPKEFMAAVGIGVVITLATTATLELVDNVRDRRYKRKLKKAAV